MPNMPNFPNIRQQIIPKLPFDSNFLLDLLLRIPPLHKRPHNSPPLTTIPLATQLQPIQRQKPKLRASAPIHIFSLMQRKWRL